MRSSSDDGIRRRASALAPLILLVAVFVSGCANPGKDRVEAFRSRLSQGDLEGSLEQVRSSRKLYGENSAFLYHMDLGVLHHYLGAWDSSIVHLARAEQIADDLYTRSVTNEAGALVTNDNLRPYRPREYESVVLAQFQLLNYLAKGDLDGGLVEARRGILLLDRLRDRDSADYRDDGALHYLHSLVFQAARERDNSLISLRRSLLAYARGKVPMPDEVREVATLRLRQDGRGKVFEEAGIAPASSEAVARRLEDAPSEIVVVTYRGRTPEIGQTRAWGEWVKGGLFAWHWSDPRTGKDYTDAIPAPPLAGGISGKTLHVNFTLPMLKETESKVTAIRVRTRDTLYTPVRLSDTRILLEQSLDERHSGIVARTIVRVATRTIAAQKLKDAVQTGNPLLDLLANLGLDFAQGEIEQSDLRQCIWLPREISVARIPVAPGTHALTVDATDRNGIVVGERVFGGLETKARGKRFAVAAFPY